MTELYKCDFCDKPLVEHCPNSKTIMFLGHNGVCICDECVELARDIIGEQRIKRTQEQRINNDT